jgi:Lipid A core - O-antigen ligase and related enzymes
MKSFPTSDLKKFLSPSELKWGVFAFCAMFLAMLSSQSVMDGFSAILIITALVWTARHFRDQWSWPRLGIDWLWLIWVPIIGIGLYINPIRTDRLDLFFEFRWILDFYVFIIFFSLFNQDQKVRKTFAIILTLCSLTALIFYFMGYNPITQDFAEREKNLSGLWRAGGLFDNPMPLAHSYAPIALVFVGFLMQNWNQRKKISPWLYAAIVLTGLTILLTFTRGVWIGAAAGLIAMGFLLRRKLGLIVLSLLIAIAAVAFATSEKIRYRVMVTVNMTNQGDHERLTLWRTNWEMFKDHPLVGTGYTQNKNLLPLYYEKMGIPEGYFTGHAHNQYIHLLAGTGILGLLCYLFFVGFVLVRSFQAYNLASTRELKGVALGCLGAQIAFFVGSLTEANFSIARNRFMILFIIAWAISIYLQEKNKKKA